MTTTQVLVLTGVGASVATQTWLPLLLAVGIAAITRGTSKPADSGVRILLRQRPSDWLLEVWVRRVGFPVLTMTRQMTPDTGQLLFARFKDSVIATLGTAPLPRRRPGSPRAGDLASLRLLYQEEPGAPGPEPFGQSGFTLFIHDPARDALIQRAVDQMTGEFLLSRFHADIATVLDIRFGSIEEPIG